MIFSRKPLAALLAAALLALSGAGCGAESPARVRRLPTRDLSIVKSDGARVALKAEIAADDPDRERGLMHRTGLPDGEGMLFVFDRDQPLSFWMKNTLLPLSIAYIATDGRILEIHALRPGSLAPVRSGRAARYALEVPLGWFDRVGVGVGDRVELPPP